MATSTLGQALRDELSCSTGILPVAEEHGQDARATANPTLPRNVLVCGEVIEEMAQREPETLDAIKRALAAGAVVLVGGELTRVPLAAARPGGDRTTSFPRIGGLSGVVAAAAR